MKIETKLKKAFTTEDFDTVIEIMTEHGFEYTYNNEAYVCFETKPTLGMYFKHPKKKYNVSWHPKLNEITLDNKATLSRRIYKKQEYDEIEFHSVLYENTYFDILNFKRDIDWINSGIICNYECNHECDTDCAELCEEEFYSTKDRISDDFDYLKEELGLSEEKLSLLKQALDYKEDNGEV